MGLAVDSAANSPGSRLAASSHSRSWAWPPPTRTQSRRKMRTKCAVPPYSQKEFAMGIGLKDRCDEFTLSLSFANMPGKRLSDGMRRPVSSGMRYAPNVRRAQGTKKETDHQKNYHY